MMNSCAPSSRRVHSVGKWAQDHPTHRLRGGLDHNRGFALVITLSLVIFLAVIAIDQLSLSTVTVRAANKGSLARQDRDNARLSVLIIPHFPGIRSGPMAVPRASHQKQILAA